MQSAPVLDDVGGPAGPEGASNDHRTKCRQKSRKWHLLIIAYYLYNFYTNSASAESNSGHSDGSSFANDHHDAAPGHEAEHRGIHIAKVDFEGVETPFIIALWIFCASLAKIGFHMVPKASQVFPESCLLIIVGLVIGLLLQKTNSVHVSPLTPSIFFNYMLPPIILDAGYFMPNRLFFNNLGTILLFAVVGTVWNTFAIGMSLWGLSFTGIFGADVEVPLLQALLFAALISAVDPVAVLAVFEEIHVNEVLYIVVFGESLLNDAVTVVLYRMFEEYAKMGPDKVKDNPIEIAKGVASFPVVALGGTLIGILWGFLTGFITRFTNHVRVIEPIFIFVMAYLSHLCAETFHMSGILAVTFCGITMKNYVEANISYKSHTTVKYAMKMLSSSSETIIFMFLGVSTIRDAHEWNWVFVVTTITFCSVYRSIGTVIFSALANRFRLHKLGRVDQFVMSYGGLRGAVAFALVLLIQKDATNNDDKLLRMFVTTTIAVIYFTVFVQGITIKPLVVWLKVKRAEKRKPTMNERIHERLFDHTMSAMESLMGQVGHHKLRDKFKQFDNTYIRPCLIRDYKGFEPKIFETFSKLTMRDAMDRMNRNEPPVETKFPPDSVADILRTSMAGSGSGGSPGGPEPIPHETSFNIDFKEFDYNISRKDMSDAKIHHMLSEELYKPYRRHRRLSYSRHAVHESDLATDPQLVNFKTQMNFKRMVSEKALKTGKQRKTGVAGIGRMDGSGFSEQGQVYDNPTFSLSDERLQRHQSDDHDGDGIYFIAGNGSTGDFHRDWNERRWSHSSCSSMKSYMETAYPHASHPIHRHARRHSKQVEFDDSPTLAELSLPWRRDGTLATANNGTAAGNSNHSLYQNPYGRFRVSPTRRMTIKEEDGSATTMEMVPPWKRDDDDESSLRQQEFPAWAGNKEYLAYSSPTNTYLGGLDKNQPRPPTVMALFKRDSVTSLSGSRRGSVPSMHYLNTNRMESPRSSIGADGSTGPPELDNIVVNNLTPNRRGSTFLAVSIPEIVEEDDDKEVFEAESYQAEHGVSGIKDVAHVAAANKIVEVDDSSSGDENGNAESAGASTSQVTGRNSDKNQTSEDSHTKL